MLERPAKKLQIGSYEVQALFQEFMKEVMEECRRLHAYHATHNPSFASYKPPETPAEKRKRLKREKNNTEW